MTARTALLSVCCCDQIKAIFVKMADALFRGNADWSLKWENDDPYLHTWIFFFFDLCSLFCLSRGSARAQLRSSVPRWDSNHLILIQYWLQFCSQSGLFNYLAAVRNVLILHLVSFRESELQHEDFELWLPYLDLGQEDQRSINKYVFQDCIKSCEDTYSYT